MESAYDYISSIKLQNIRCFGDETTIDFRLNGNDDRVSQWNLILGNNGTGKTTILQMIYLGVAEAGRHRINTNVRLKKDENQPAIFKPSSGLHWRENRHVKKPNIGVHEVSMYNDVKLEHKDLIKTPVIAYSATRKIGSRGLSKETADTSKFGETLFSDNATLINAEEWLIQSDYIDRLKEGNKNGKQSSNGKEKVIAILKTLMKDSISDIKIELVDDVPKVLFKSHYGWVGLHQLSLGYKTLIAWMVDFASKLMAFYPESKNPLEEKAILLIDEIDLHLHVSFQRKLVEFLTKTFKNTQFIATAHSPLIVQASENANIILLEREGNQVVAKQNIYDVRNWRIDQIYASELFENQNVRSDKISKLIEKKSSILAKANPTEKDKVDLEEIDRQIGDLPTGRDATEIEAMGMIKKAALYLKKK